MLSIVCSVIALCAGDLETTLQIELSGMSRGPSDSIKTIPNRLCLESAM